MKAAIPWLAAMLCAACASTPTPTVIAQAGARLDSRDAVNLTSVRPGLMREAREHLLRARRAVLEEDADAAELYGHLALQRYETAAGFTARDLITARLGAMDRALGRVTEQADALAAERAALQKAQDAESRAGQSPTAVAAVVAPPPSPAPQTAEPDPADAAAQAAIVEARTRRATALGAGRDRRCPDVFRGVDALIELAVDRQAAGAAPDALTAATRAQERLDGCDVAPAPASVPLAAAVDPGRGAAEQAITAAQQALARGRAAGLVQSRLDAGAGLIEDARGWYTAGVWPPAATLAEQARVLLTPVAGALDPAAAEARAAVARSRALGQRYADRRTDPLYIAAQGMQAEAERALAAGRHDEALRVAGQAAATWLSIGPLPPGTAPKGPGGSPAVGIGLAVGAVDGGGSSAVEGDWRPAYREILGTLTLRDRADAMASSPTARAAVDGGERELAEARRLYQARDYGGARRSAALAAADFRAAISGAPAPAAPDGKALAGASTAGSPTTPEASAEPGAQRVDLRRIAEAAARDAVAQAAADRAAAERVARAQQDATERVEAERRLAEARAAEATARAALAAAEARNQQQADARDAAAAEQLAGARARVDSARERQVLCLKLGCPARDPTAWARAEEALRTATDALAAESAETALRAAERAIALMDEAAARPAPFTVPADQAEVSRDGDQLRLRTRLRFETGRDGLRPGAGPALDALARVITENQGVIDRVRLVGFTDDRGSAASNRALSARRAAAVREALIARGVPADRLVAEGRGEADPAFDNRTLDGRLKNRRVEIRLELQEAP